MSYKEQPISELMDELENTDSDVEIKAESYGHRVRLIN